MKGKSEKEESFYLKWEERRKKKWQYVFLHGSIYWGVPSAITLFLLSSNFSLENMQFSKLLISIVVFAIGGLGFGLWLFNTMDKAYLGANDNDKIKEGIQKIKSGLTWSYENLKLLQDESDTLVVQNELFWFDDANVTPTVMNECFNLIMVDYNRLQRNAGFSEFSKDKKVLIQMFDNSGNDKPLIEKVVT